MCESFIIACKGGKVTFALKILKCVGCLLYYTLLKEI